jgi:uncharacterized protein (DUF2141 family)
MLTWLFFFSLFFFNQEAVGTSSTSLTIEITNIKHQDKELRIAVCEKADFLKDTKPFKFKVFKTKLALDSVTFVLPKGSYAVSVFHDLNGNGILDKNLFGAPKEPYGFSKNYRPVIRAPRFDEVKVEIGDEDKKISIELIHP